MFRKFGYLTAAMILTTCLAHAQQSSTGPVMPVESQVYCDGIVTNQAMPTDAYVISGVESDNRVVYYQGQHVFLDRGSSQGVKIGDTFQVTRQVSDPLREKWFDYQDSLLKAMGTPYADIGRVRVVSVLPKTSIALVTQACSPIQRGDLIQPFAERPAPAFKAKAAFDQFAPPSGKAKAMIVVTSVFGQMLSEGAIAYVNLGSGQGVKVGDYFRVYRYQDTHHDAVFQTKGNGYKMEGAGSTPVPYIWSDLPRDVLGEGIVLRTGPNASTVLMTTALRAVYVGDYVELE